MHNGNGHGKRWLLIALLVLGGFWLVNDAYRDGYTDALVQTGQVANARYYRGGPHFPWGLVILGGIGYIAWRKGAFDRFGGPGGPYGGRGVQRYGGSGPAPAPGQGFGPMFRGPRAFFEEWHRQAHEAARTGHQAPPAPPAGQPQAHAGNGTPPTGVTQTPAPPAPTPDYWAAMARPGASEPSATPAPQAPASQTGEAPRGETGPTTERW